MGKELRRRLRSALLEGASRGAVFTPALLLRGGLRAAAWTSRFSTFERRTLSNLELAYGDELTEAERQAIARGVRRHLARQAEEWLLLAGRRRGLDAWLEARVEVDPSVEILETEMARGRGVLVATGHIGNWELLAATLKRIGFRGAVVGMAKHRDPSADWLVNMRRNYGVETLSQRANPRELLRVLQKGELLGVLCDLEVRRLAGEHIPFFGRPALTMTAPAALARARKLPLVPVRCVLPDPEADRYRLLVDEPLALDPELPRKEASTELLTRLNQLFERWIRESPTQWAWHQHRWRWGPEAGQSVPLAARSGQHFSSSGSP